MKFDVKRIPSYILISSKVAIPSNTGTVISSGIEKTKELPPNFEEDAAIGPFLRVIEAGGGEIFVASTKKLITALAAFLDLGKYPIFFAKDTTFSLKVALSMDTSFATMLALYEVMYVLYANTSRIDERFDPSKS